MAREVAREVAAIWRRNPPELAQDASTAGDLRAALARMRRRWEKGFDELADGFGRKVSRDGVAHADRAFAAQLRKAGFTVKFRLTPAASEVMQASIIENVALIKSIPAQYFTQIESIVAEGVRIGRDMHVIAERLENQLGVTKRRAAMIAADQTRKASAAILNVRYREVGITQARWLHSGGGEHPRVAHVEMDGKTYEIATGMWDRTEKRHVHPGELIQCRCVSRAIVPGLE